MTERNLFVFAGQSNMMGACALEPTVQYVSENSFEYKHKPRRLGEKSGVFTLASKNVGEFSYIDLRSAYPTGKIDELSELTDYEHNAYFAPAMCNVDSISEKTVKAFSDYSEKTAKNGASLPYYFVREWESLGHRCSYTHIAKGGVSIRYYFDSEMIEQVNNLIDRHNRLYNTTLPLQNPTTELESAASKYFRKKTADFFADAEKTYFKEDTSFRPFVWLQGETDSDNMDRNVYKCYLQILNSTVRKLGCTHFLCVRVGFWGNTQGREIMRAQEEFCQETLNARIITRACSMMPYYNVDEKEYYISPPKEEYRNCRDSFLGFNNQHINEKGFLLIAKRMAKNTDRLLKNKPIVLEKENVKF